MPENEKPVNQQWLVKVAGRDTELPVWGAYVQWHTAGNTTVHTLTHSDLVMVTIKDDNHKVAFQAPAQAVAYILRADAVGRIWGWKCEHVTITAGAPMGAVTSACGCTMQAIYETVAA